MTLYPELQTIVREETDNGRTIVRFMQHAMDGRFPNFTPVHQIMAGRVLAILCIEQGIEFVESIKKPAVPKTRDSAQRRVIDDEADAALTAAQREIAAYVRKLAGGGRRMIKFLLEAMEGALKSFSPSLRIAAGKELIGYAFPIFAPPRPRKSGSEPRSKTQDEPAAKPTPRAQTAAAPQFTYPPAGVPLGMPREEAERLYRMRHCEEGETIDDSIFRRSMEKSDDMEVQRAEARKLWEEKETFIKKRCPNLDPEPYPELFDGLLDLIQTAPEDPNDWWDDEDWELCEMGLCGETGLPCPCTTVPREKDDP